MHQPSKQATETKGCFGKASFTLKGAGNLSKRSDLSNLVLITRQFWTEKGKGRGLLSSHYEFVFLFSDFVMSKLADIYFVPTKQQRCNSTGPGH